MSPSATSNEALHSPTSTSSSLFEDAGAPSPSRLGALFDNDDSPFAPAASSDASQTLPVTPTETQQTSPITSPPPPYWSPTSPPKPSSRPPQTNHAFKRRREAPGAITLQDNESRENGDDVPADGGVGRDRNRACWARGVVVPDWTVVGNGLGKFVCYNVKVETLRGPSMFIRKRFSEFDRLRNQLLATFPHHDEKAIPDLGGKTPWPTFSHEFLEKRRSKLQYFLNCVLLNPEFAGAPVVKDFLFDLSSS